MYRSLAPDSVRTTRFAFGALVVSAIAFGGFFISSAHAAITTINLVSPNGGEEWRGTQSISWSGVSDNTLDSIDITYAADGINFNQLVAQNVLFSAGSFSWNTSSFVESSSARVHISPSIFPTVSFSSTGMTVDNTAPVTTATPSFAPASTGWYNIVTGVPTIELSCVDGAVGSGCNDTYYAWDSDAPAIYTGPLTPPEGVHTLSFYSNDNATDALGVRNVESLNSLEVKVDTSAPAAPIVVLTDPVNATNQTSVMITGTGEANASVAFSIDDTNIGTPTVSGTGSVDGAGSISISGVDVSSLDDDTLTLSVVLTDAAGNTGPAGVDTTTKDTVAVISSVISDATLAGVLKIGDTITFTMTPSLLEPGSSVSGLYNGQALSWSDDGLGASYSATYTVTEGDADQASPLQISGVTFTDAAGNVSAPADGTGVEKTIDANSPTLSLVSISSDNSNPAWATVGDTVTLSFTSSEGIDTPTVLLDGMSATVVNTAGNDWTASYTFAGGETEGIIPFSIVFVDTAGNAGISVLATTDLSSVTYDEAPPLAPSITAIASDDYINNSEKGEVHVVGTAEAGSTVSITLIDSTLASVTATGTATAGGTFDIALDGTTLLDGAITSSATATDAAGNESPADTAAVATKDIVAPTVSSITTKDADADGSIDTATIVFSEDMEDSSFSAGAFSIGGTLGTVFVSGVLDDGTIDVSHAGVAGTEKKDVLYAPGTAMDLAGNPLAAVASGDVSEIDDAGPVLLSARTIDTTHTTATFSEDLNGGTVNVSGSEFSVASSSIVSASETSSGVVTLTYAPALGTDATPEIGFENTGTFRDLNEVEAITPITIMAVDGVAPTLSGVTISSDNDADTAAPEWAKVGDTVTLSFTSSETIDTPTVLLDGMSATVVNTAGNDWTASYTFAGGETEGVIPFSIVFEDLATPAHNAGTAVTATDDSSSVFFDEAAPEVDAGTDKEVNAFTTQDATASDPAPASDIATYAWTQVSGPGTIIFGTPAAEDTTLSADVDGTYVLSLAVTDNAGNSASDTMTFIWDTTNPEPLTSSPSDGTTGVAIASGTATVMYDEDIVLLDSSRVLLVNDATGASYKGAVEVSGGNGNSAVLNIGYSGLEYGTTYRINVKPNAAEDIAGNNAASNIISYFTTIVDTQSPTIQSLSASGIDETSATLSATTNENATCRYAATDSAYESMAPMSTTGGTSHSQDVIGLSAGTGYTFFVRCQDASGNAMTTSGIASFTTSTPAPDTDAPPAPSIATISATVNADSYAISGAAGADTPAPGARTISVYNGATLAGTAVVPAGQTGWSVLVQLNQNMENSFTAVSTDTAGNSSAASAAVVIVEDETTGADIVASDVPEIATADATIDADTYEIAGTLADDGGVRTLALLKDGVVVGTAILSAGQTDWAITVSLVQDADNVFTASATDEVGNASGESDAVTITEAIDDTAALAVTGIDTVRSFASADNTFDNGWKWTFHITVPTSETSFAMKFADFTSGANSIPAATNIRFYSAQSSDAFDASSAIVVATAGEYGSTMALSADLDADTAGRQIEVTVEARVPESTSGGSYSTSYGVRSEPSL